MIFSVFFSKLLVHKIKLNFFFIFKKGILCRSTYFNAMSLEPYNNNIINHNDVIVKNNREGYRTLCVWSTTRLWNPWRLERRRRMPRRRSQTLPSLCWWMFRSRYLPWTVIGRIIWMPCKNVKSKELKVGLHPKNTH